MQAILYVAHGSRVKAGIDEALRFIDQVKSRVAVSIQEVSFLELAEPTILQGVAQCVQQGATKIAVAPILLLTANHLNQDIPAEIAEAKKQFPSVTFTIGDAFGVDDRLVETLHQRLLEVNEELTGANVLLIGRGSSDAAVERDLTQIASRLKERGNLHEVATCFLYGKGVSFEQSLERLASENRKTFIVPYLLFSGLLKQHIETKIAEVQQINQAILLCNCLGYDEQVQHVFVDRIHQLLEKGRDVHEYT